MNKLKVIIYGINGKMGGLLAQHLANDSRFSLIAGVDPVMNKPSSIPVFHTLEEAEKPDCIIDFSHHSQIEIILKYALKKRVALVIATTGYNELEKKMIVDASKLIPIFYSANMSFGVQIINRILRDYINVLENDFDIEIIEKHHSLKADAPSGTANMLAKTIIDASTKDYKIIYGRSGQSTKRLKKELAIHAVRGGSIVGEHTVLFAGNEEVIELTHKAESKAIFVHGAIKATVFICSQTPGLYSMDDFFKKE